MIGYVIVFAIFGWVVLKYNNQDYFLQNLITVNTKKSTQDIAFIKDIASIVTMAEYVYQIEDAKHKSSNSQQIRLIRKNLDKILYTHEVFYDTNSYELMTHNPSRAQVAIFLDYKKKAIFVIIAGTRLEGSREHLIYDIKDNLYLITGTVPSKVESIMNLNKSIVFKYKDKLQKGWVIHYSGHSLGAYYAEFGALHMC
jgi:hypothetical protein